MRWIALAVIAAAAPAQEGDGAAGKGEARARAVRALGRAGGEGAVEAARAALADPDGNVRAAAAIALVRLGAADARVVEALAAALLSPDWYTRWDACLALSSLGPPAAAAAPALLAAAADPALDLSREAARALARVAPKDPQVVKELVRLLESDRDLDRDSLLGALDATGQAELAQEWLARELVSNRHGLRGKAAALLGKCGVRGFSHLEEALKSDDPLVRAAALHRLGDEEKIGPAVFAAVLAGDPAPEMRRAAVSVLRKRKAVAEAPRIAAALDDPEPEVRLRAARALEEFEMMVPEAGPGLVRLVADGDRELSIAALAAMRATGFAALAAFLECRRETPRPDEVVWAVRLRPRGGTEDLAATLDLLIAALEDNRHGAALATALRETLAKDEDSVLIETLAADDDALRRATAMLLGHLGRDRAACGKAIEKALKDRHPDVRAAAAQALQRLRP